MIHAAGVALALTILYSLYWIELLALILAARFGKVHPGWGARWFRAVERTFGRLARRRRLAVVVTGVAALAVRAALLPVIPNSQPLITDEFSYLLAADTFASGRLTNPSHPMWVHLETIHILSRPTYASMYHAAQGLILAAGKVVAGHEWTGVWASVALMCALLCWMLQGWLPPAWALLGGLLAVIRLGLFGYWVNSYWGGAAAAIGGLLVLGAWPRILKRTRTRDAVLLAVGLAILANSRPYEGLVLSAPIGVLLALWFFKLRGRSLGRAAVRVVLPALLTLSVAAAGTVHYYNRVTGNPFRMPYQVDRDEYAVAGIFLWEQPRPAPAYRNQQIRNFYQGWELTKFLEAKTPAGLAKNTIGKAVVFWLFFLGPAFTLPLLFLPRIRRDRRMRPLLVVGGISVIGLAVNTWFYPHYAAPMTGVIYALVLQGMRHLRAWRRNGFPSGHWVARTIPLVCIGIALLRIAAQPLQIYITPNWPMAWYSTSPGNYGRAVVQTQLEREPGRQLAIVHYSQDHNPLDEWVYNQASVDSAKVVWARDLNPGQNRELIRYYANRRAWLVNADANPPTAAPYLEPIQPGVP